MGVGRLIRRRAAYFFYLSFLRLQARGHDTAIRNATTVGENAIPLDGFSQLQIQPRWNLKPEVGREIKAK